MIRVILFFWLGTIVAVNCRPQSCSGVSCLPNPGNCKANYASGSCCPTWNCANKDGGTYNTYGQSVCSLLISLLGYGPLTLQLDFFEGLSRVGGGPGSSFSQSSISTSSSNGSPSGRFGSTDLSKGTGNFGFAPLPRLLTPYEIKAIVRAAFPPGWFNGNY